MLRLAVARSARTAAEQRILSPVRAQWLVPRPQCAPVLRTFADARSPDKTILPGSQSSTSAGVPQPPILNPKTPTATPEISPAAAPRVPPTPAEAASTLPPTGPGTASTSPPPPPPKPKRRPFRRFLLTLIILSALGYGGGVYYSLVNDNFHDFFTEYIPGGEDAVAYFEDREFRKRFPQKEHASKTWAQTRGENKVTIGRSSGVNPRVSDAATEDLGQKGRHVSAVADNNKPKPDAAQQRPAEASPREKTQAVESAKKAGNKSSTDAKSSANQQAASKPAASTPTSATSTPSPAIPAVEHTAVDLSDEPVVQQLVKMVNNVVTAVNASPEAGKLSSTVQTLKSELNNAVAEIGKLKQQHSQDAEAKLQSAHSEFDKAAQELVRRLEQEMREQEAKWREEYEQERERLSNSYQQRLAAELDVAQKVADQTHQNNLIQQEIALQKKYMQTVKSKVEEERSGRLAKLDELASSVSELEKLTGEWNSVLDSTLQTQHLQVAVEAVKAKVLESEIPQPFVNELVALKEVSKEDDIVNAAIASINPIAYQHGIASPANLIDRFRRVATEVRRASLLPEDAGIASHAASAVLSRFMFQKKADRGLPEGDDVEATLARTEVLLEEGDIDAAAREMNGLKGWAGVLSKDWVRECRRVLEVRQAVDVIATEARLKSLLVG